MLRETGGFLRTSERNREPTFSGRQGKWRSVMLAKQRTIQDALKHFGHDRIYVQKGTC